LQRDKMLVLGRLSLVIDGLITALSLWLAYFSWWLLYQVVDLGKDFHGQFSTYAYLYLVIIPFFPLLYKRYGLYESIGFRTGKEVVSILAKGLIVGLATITVIFFVAKIQTVSRPLLLAFAGISFCLIYLKEALILEYFRYARQQERSFRKILVCGAGEVAERVIGITENHPEWGYKICGVVVPDSLRETTEVSGYGVVGTYSDVSRILSAGQYDQVFFAAGKHHLDEVEEAVHACELQGIDAWLIADFFQGTIARVRTEEYHNLPALVFSSSPEFSWSLLFKSVVDKLGAAILLILSSPLFLLVPIIIKLTSRGPVLFKQGRAGLRGKEFTMYKFRSMHSSAEQMRAELDLFNEMDGAAFKMTNDPRVTRFGKFLRRTSIDELPQLLNVLKGEMSLVGPRPLCLCDVDKFKEWQRRRQAVKPGLTCLWQISGRNEIDFETWMKLDLEYIDNWSLALDLKILLRTIPLVLFCRGAK
jgi:exopolysaccharide biosynthesis polyprenyl glycosylphosphotransferase